MGDRNPFRRLRREALTVRPDVYVDVLFRPRGTLIDTSAEARQGAISAGVKISEKL
ncbi:MAG: hypothetical protein JWP91_1361 [Fibrobacteres bacterium]|nr:hypothetical protein [Fibrobacterota bacterium]